MIVHSIEYHDPHLALVNAYNMQENKDHTYWEHDEVDHVRGFIKAHYENEQAFKCCYCGMHLHTRHGRVWDAEHIVPKSTHPQFLFEPKNLAVSCIDCNTEKGSKNVLSNPRIRRYPKRSEAFIIVHPHYDNLDDHVAVILNRFFFPKTEKGENTIRICRLTRYAYEFLYWDSGLGDDNLLMELFQELMSAGDETTRKLKIFEILATLQIQTSRSLR